jgi:hypothetical protein
MVLCALKTVAEGQQGTNFELKGFWTPQVGWVAG